MSYREHIYNYFYIDGSIQAKMRISTLIFIPAKRDHSTTKQSNLTPSQRGSEPKFPVIIDQLGGPAQRGGKTVDSGQTP